MSGKWNNEIKHYCVDLVRLGNLSIVERYNSLLKMKYCIKSNERWWILSYTIQKAKQWINDKSINAKK